MSDLFLDTELQEQDLQRIAATIRASGLSIAEARGVLLNELCPALLFNLKSIAGEWAGFDEKWLIDRILDTMHPNLLMRLQCRWYFWLVKKDWLRVAEIVEAKETHP